jgi:uroporphyrinogen-III synthase
MSGERQPGERQPGERQRDDRAALPLAGLDVLVTRPAAQAGALAREIESHGGRAVVVPLIEIVDAPAGTVRDAVAGLTAHDWVVVASPNAAGVAAGELAGCPARLAAVGTATASALRAGAPERDVLVPSDQRAASLVEALIAACASVPARAVVVQSAEGASTLAEGLTGAGWAVTRITSHRPVARHPSPAEVAAAGQAHAWLLTSGSQARAWTEVLAAVEPPALIVSIGPQTTRDAEEVGLKIAATAADHTVPGVVNALERVVSTSPGG